MPMKSLLADVDDSLQSARVSHHVKEKALASHYHMSSPLLNDLESSWLPEEQ